MKVIKNDFKSQVEYAGFSEGGKLDRDYLAEFAGVERGSLVAIQRLEFQNEKEEKFAIEIYYELQGGMRLLILADTAKKAEALGISEKEFDRIYSEAESGDVRDSKDLEILHKLVNEYPDEVIGETCWYEGKIRLLKCHPSGEKTELINSYESNLGLDGVCSSVAELREKYLDSAACVELAKYLLYY